MNDHAFKKIFIKDKASKELMLSVLVLVLTIILFTLASIEDIKKREVYDFLNYFYFFAILAVGILDSIIQSQFGPILYVGYGVLAGFFLGALFYYLGMWGGGDAKFMIGFGGASFYLISSFSFNSELLSYVFYAVNSVKNVLPMVDLVLSIITAIALLYLVIFLLVKRRTIIDLLSILIILLLELIILNPILSFEWALLLMFVGFGLLMFSDERIFGSVFFVRKISAMQVHEGDRLEDKKLLAKLKITEKENNHGLRAEQVKEINKLKEKTKIRVNLPYFTLIMINFLVIIVNFLTQHEPLINQTVYLITFLLLSFVIGGVIALGIIVVQYIRYRREIKIALSILDKITLFILFAFVFALSMIDLLLSIPIFMLMLLIPFLKMAKATEKYIFVSDKPLSKIVPGDWIVGDIKKSRKIIMKKEEFKLGINEHQIEVLKKKLPKEFTLKVKDGLAFLPPMFIAFLVLLFI